MMYKIKIRVFYMVCLVIVIHAGVCAQTGESADLGSVGKLMESWPHSLEKEVEEARSDVSWLDLYVDAVNGNDQHGNGMENNPFKTISRALEATGNTGTKIHLAPGDYYETANIAKDHIVFSGSDPDTTRIIVDVLPFRFSRCSDGTIQNIGFKGIPDSQNLVFISYGSHVNIINCYFEGGDIGANYSYGSSGIILYSTFVEQTWRAVDSRGSHVRVYGCDISNCESGVTASDGGIALCTLTNVSDCNSGMVSINGSYLHTYNCQIQANEVSGLMAWNYSCLHVLGNTVINGSETGIFIHNAGRLILGNAAISDCISGIDIYPQGHVTTCFFGTVDCNITECDQGISVSELSTLNMMHGGSDIDISGNGVGIRIWPGGRAVLDPAWITGNTTNLINDGEIF